MMRTLILITICMFGLSACTFTETAGKNHAMTGDKAHLNTTGIGLKFLFTSPIAGTPTIDGAVNGLAEDAKKTGANNIEIVQSSSTNLWWIFPPFSIILNPIITNVAADVK